MNHRIRYEYRISYWRPGWSGRQTRFRQSENAARRLAGRILYADDTQAGPIVFVSVERREVGEWEHVIEVAP